MYSERIESLITAALADGVVTDQERKVLLRKAMEEGIDLDEFNMVLDARIVEMQKKNGMSVTGAAPASRSSSSKQGGVIKCPACGTPIPSMSAVCPECGHEFRNMEAVKSAQQLFEALQEVERRKSRTLRAGKMRPGDIDRQFHKEKLTLIRTFPVPNSKEDLMEMLAMTSSNAYDNDGVVGKDEEAWLQKTDQVYQKVVMVCSKDPETLKRATSLVTSLMRRLPDSYKEFTHLPNEMLQYAQAELKESKLKEAEYRKEKTMELLRSPIGLLGPGAFVLGLLLFIIAAAAQVNALGWIGILIFILGCCFIGKFNRKFKEIRSSNGIYC